MSDLSGSNHQRRAATTCERFRFTGSCCVQLTTKLIATLRGDRWAGRIVREQDYNGSASSDALESLMLRHRLVVIALFTGILAAVPAAAQEAGVRAGVSADPDQFYFGGHLETPPLLDRLHFRPNVEIGVGDNVTLVAFNIEFAYHFPTGPNWYTYVGGGPALNFIRFRGNTNSEGGFNLLVGVQHNNGLFAELKAGLADSPNLKVGVGYAVRLR